jgi:hypothetical protein
VATASEELERLADLRDRGVLTQAEFDEQKALLLHAPPAAPAAPAPPPPIPPAPIAPPPKRGSAVPAIMVVGGLVIVALVLVLLWAAGVLRLPRMSSKNDAEINSWATAARAPAASAAPAMNGPAAAPPPQAQFPPSEASSSNPLIGVWIAESIAGKTCPTRIVFGPSDVTISEPDGSGGTKMEIHPIVYVVQSPTAVSIAQPGVGSSANLIQIQNGHLYLDGCDLHR